MKTPLLFVFLILALAGPPARAATSDTLDQTFQAAILAEEARRDLAAAIRGYEEVVAKVDAQRTLAATAVFRLGECYRKIGRTNDAVAQYQRLIRDFPAEETLVRLARENLTALGMVGPASPPHLAIDDAVAGVTPPKGTEDAEIRRLRTLLDRSPDLLNAATPPDGKTPLILAAERGQLAVVQALVGWGAEVNRAAGRGDTALIAAARSGHKAVVEALLDAKADPSLMNREGRTALAAAVERRYGVVVETLLARGALPAKETENSALFAAIETVQTNVIERLVKAGADVNRERPRTADGANSRPATPLEAAINLSPGDFPPVIRTLLRLGAVPKGTDRNHPVSLLVRRSSEPVLLKELIQATPKGELPAGLLDELLIEAVRISPKEDQIPVLLAAGASVDSSTIANLAGAPLICLAAEVATPRALEALLHAKPNLDAVNTRGQTALHLASLLGKSNHVALLLKAGADPNRLDRSDMTALTAVRQLIAQRQPPSPRSIGTPGLPSGPPAPGMVMPIRANSPGSLQDYQAVETLLLAHGASGNVVRRLHINAYRGTQQDRLLRRSGDDPAPRLSDILLMAFGNSSQWLWPQLSALSIDRITPDGKGETRIEIPADWMNRQDCSWNVQLQWGDAIQIPEEDHVQGQGWPGLPEAAAASLVRCSSRRITLVIKEETHEIVFLPTQLQRQGSVGAFFNAGPFTSIDTSTAPRIKAPETLTVCQLWPVLERSRVLRLSSDLTRVRVTRAATSQTWTLDVANDPRAQTFWLLDGDRIEVPEKQP